MKVGILGDFHLGYERFYEDSFEQAERAMREACAGADVVILLGDLFDSKTPKPEVLAKSFSIFRIPFERQWEARLVEYTSRDGRKPFTNIPVVAIHGTHERRIKDLINPIQTLEHAGFLINAHASTVVFEKGGERVAIQGFGGIPEEYAKNAMLSLDFKPVDNAVHAFVFHQNIKEFIGESVPGISLEDLPKGFDLYLCGHIHTKREERMEGGLLLIPGSTVITQLRKSEEAPKGFYIYDTSKKQAAFKEIETRPFFYGEIELKEASMADALSRCREFVEGIVSRHNDGKKPVIKLKLKGTLAKGLQPANLDIQSLSEGLNEGAVVEIDKNFEVATIKEKIEKLRSLREQKLSAREAGMEILKEKLKEYKFDMKIDVETLFDMLSEEGKDSAENVLKKLLENRQKADGKVNK